MMNIVFRADASATIGTGHVMRCLALAQALVHEHQVSFMCNMLDTGLAERIRGCGIALIMLPELVPDEALQAKQCLAALTSNVDLLIIDHYQLGASFAGSMRQRCRHIMVIDDLANRAHDCDILLDQNFLPQMQSRYQTRIPADCRCLLGPAYVLLRPEFYQQSTLPREHLLIFFGGADEKNLTRKALLAARDLASSFAAIDVVLGSTNPWITALQQEFADMPSIQWHINCTYMAHLMAQAQLSLGAGGGTHWERAYMNVPSYVVTVADNQRATTAYLAELEACVWLGDDALDVSVFTAALTQALQHPEKLTAMADNARHLLPDNAGIPLVVHAINQILGNST